MPVFLPFSSHFTLQATLTDASTVSCDVSVLQAHGGRVRYVSTIVYHCVNILVYAFELVCIRAYLAHGKNDHKLLESIEMCEIFENDPKFDLNMS